MFELAFVFCLGLLLGWNVIPQPKWVKDKYTAVLKWVADKSAS